MEFFSHRMVNTAIVTDIRAPKGKMFEIYGFMASTFGSNNARVLVLDRIIEDDAPTLTSQNSMFAMDCNISGHSESTVLPKPIDARYISIGATGAVSVWVIVYYELRNATKVELIWEFLRRGKNP